jgi:type II secretory pathway pseudopilin PulG
MRNDKILGEKGFILITVYLIIVLLMMLTGSFVAGMFSQKAATESQHNVMSAFYVAESAAAAAYLWVQNPAPNPLPGQGEVIEITQYLAVSSIVIPEKPHLDINARAWAYRVPGVSNPRFIIFSLGSVLDENQRQLASRQVVKEVQLENFTKYAYFTDDEHFLVWYGEVPVWFTTGSFLEGPVHTNSNFNISGDPIFDGPVSSHGDFINYMNGGPPADNPDFRQGIQLGVDAKPTNRLNANRLKTAAGSGAGMTLTGDTTVALVSDGTMNVTNSNEGWDNQNMLIPGNGALFVEGGDLTISGTLKGKLTAGSSDNIVISDNLLYETDPTVAPSNDMLALISETNVIVSSDAPHNVSVFGTVIATEGSFIVENWSQGPAKGTLTVYGGIIQIERGPVGTFNPRTNRRVSGYEKDYYYDQRFWYDPPNWVPTTGDYEVISSQSM